MSNLKEIFKDWGEYYRTVGSTPPKAEAYEVLSVRLDQHITTYATQRTGTTNEIRRGDMIAVSDGVIANCEQLPTHEVMAIYKTESGITLELSSIPNNEPLTIKL